MDLDDVRYTTVPGSVIRVSENDKEISNFFSRVTSYWGYVGGYFYQGRFYLLLRFMVEEERRSVLFRVDNYQEQIQQYSILKSLVNTYVPFRKAGQTRARAIRIVDRVEQIVRQGGKLDEGTFLEPDESYDW